MKKVKGRGRSKEAIIGIALAVIIVASFMIAMIGSTSAYSVGGKYNIINKDAGATAQSVLIGQELDFSTNWGTSKVTIYQVKEAVEWTQMADANNRLVISGNEWKRDGSFYVNYVEGAGTKDAQLSFSDPDMPLKLKVWHKEVSTLARGTFLRVDVGGINLFDEDTVDLVIIGPKGQIENKNGQTFTNITVSSLTGFSSSGAIDTTNWDIGDYTFQVKTKPAKACGLDDQSPKRELTILKGTVQIKADTTEVPELENVRLTVTGVPGRSITVTADPLSPNVIFPVGINDNPRNVATNNFNDTIDADGVMRYVVKFNDTGAYTIKVTDTDEGTDDTVDITVAEKAVIFDVPGTVVIGQRFKIKGTVNTGDTIDIAVEDEIVEKLNDIVIDEYGKFEAVIDTSAEDAPPEFQIPGSVRLKAYIDRSKGPGYIGANEKDDGSVAILMTRGELMAELSNNNIAQGDEFTITGTAQGAKSVDILIVAPMGYNGSNINGGKEMYQSSTPVSTTDDTFYKKISVGDDVDTRRYLVMVLSPGSDGKYGATEYDTLDDALKDYALASRTQDEMLEVILDIMSLSDDLLWKDMITVESPYVTLDPIVDVTLGEPLEVTGTANREEGFTIVVTVKGLVELTPAVVNVEKGTFKAAFDTSNAVPGTYTVKADDCDGNTDTATVNILAALTPATMLLHKSWNFVSMPKKLAAGNSTFEDVFSMVNTSGHSSFYYDVKEGWTAVNSTEKVMPLRGYWVYSAETTLVNLKYDTYPLRTPTTRQLYKGWNAIGFSDTVPATTNSVLTSFEQNWAYLIGFDAVCQDYESAIINNDETGGVHDENHLMQPMKGYWVYATEDCELAGISV